MKTCLLKISSRASLQIPGWGYPSSRVFTYYEDVVTLSPAVRVYTLTILAMTNCIYSQWYATKEY
jgi:hypothetical protein